MAGLRFAGHATSQIEWLANKSDWSGFKSIIRSESEIQKNGEVQKGIRYFISSLEPNAQEMAMRIRDHWKIENQMHWVLDVVFREDDCRVRKDNAPQNIATLNRIALNLVRKAPGKGSLKRKRKRAGWNDEFLVQVIKANSE